MMKKMTTLIFVLLFAGMQFSCEEKDQPKPNPEPKPIEVSPQARQLIDSDNRFGLELFRHISAGQDQPANTMISPVSVSLALAMTYNGAAGETGAGMQQTLYLSDLSKKEINESYRALMEALLTVDPKVTMEIGNSIWYRQGFTVEQDFLDVNKEYYDARVEALDFDSPDAVQTINNWVDDQTQGKIPKIINSIDPLTMMYLINAIYFNGKWSHQFDKDKTSQQPFYLSDGSEIQVAMMQNEAGFRYLENDLLRAVEMPYGRGNYSMVCMLPREDQEVGDLIQQLNADNWSQWIQDMDSTTVQVHLPRFSFEYGKTLNELLKAMGMEDAFDPSKSDFSGINPDRKDLHISEVKHKTFVEVDEKGTEAAAVTSVTVGVTSADPQPVVIQFNRPFLFAIREVTTGTIMFLGKVEKP